MVVRKGGKREVGKAQEHGPCPGDLRRGFRQGANRGRIEGYESFGAEADLHAEEGHVQGFVQSLRNPERQAEEVHRQGDGNRSERHWLRNCDRQGARQLLG